MILDRRGEVIVQETNSRGEYSRPGEMPEKLKALVLAKEDRWFSYHPGINPWSTLRAIKSLLGGNSPRGSSTLTEQLAKILLGNENDRTFGNKVRELEAAFALEVFMTKKDILDMYLRSAYLGRNSRGFPEASYAYFGKPLGELSDSELFSLVATLGNPSTRNPGTRSHSTYARFLAKHMGEEWSASDPIPAPKRSGDAASFELRSLEVRCAESVCMSSIDRSLTSSLRQATVRFVEQNSEKKATHAAIVVLAYPENEILAIVGTPFPRSTENGYQMNMALSPRPTGSTLKPLIYALAFEKGLRPYTTVLDAEYRYDIGTGFPLYPKNYDGTYHGKVTLDHALANSLNVPAVKVLEFIGIKEFERFLTRELGFSSLLPLETYQFGIALGGLEMDLLTLTHALSPLAQGGKLKPLSLWKKSEVTGTNSRLAPMLDVRTDEQIIDPGAAELINKILTDRTLGVEQFGLNNNLAIPGLAAAVKTGTSRDYHDSWTVGWTPDFMVGVWVGNAENSPLASVSGSVGAGKLWQDAMGILANSSYNKRTRFPASEIVEFSENGRIIFGLPDDDLDHARNILNSGKAIVSPHHNDTFLFRKGISIPLEAREEVTWTINDVVWGNGKKQTFSPDVPGEYVIRAENDRGAETLVIRVIEGVTLQSP
jgi:membrane carboxypeptidase/penicillin-binding protein PbpC